MGERGVELGLHEDIKKRPDGITLISLFLTLTSIITVNQAIQTLIIVLPSLPYLPELFAPYSEVWLEELTSAERQWLNWALPAEAVLNISLLALGLLALIVVFGLFTGKSWSYKPAFAVPVSSAVISGLAVALYASAPYELYFEPEFTFNLIFTPVNLIWVIVLLVYLRKPNINQYVIGSVSPPPLPLSSLYPGTWKGEVIKAIMMHGRPLKWRELQNATGLEEKSLNRALYELINSEQIRKVGKKYELSDKLYADYNKFFNLRKTELTSWISQWKKVRKLDFSLEHEHFFLEGRHLDDFSKELISHAKSEVLVVNPFIQDCDLSNTLRDVKKKGIEVQIITRPPYDKYPEYLKRKQEYHAKLKQDGITLIYKKKVHAKLLVVDRAVTIASSMNFYPDSSAGVSWEAGLISTDPKVVESVVQSTLSRLS